MKKINKRKLNKWCRKYINVNNIKISILFVPLVILFVEECRRGEFKIEEFMNISILVSFIMVFICEIIAKMLSSLIIGKTEDAMKLSEDYTALVKKYSKEQDKMVHSGRTLIPAVVLSKRTLKDPPFEIDISHDNYKKKYELPEQIADNSDKLFEAHDHSVIYNNMNIRLDDLQCDDKFKIKLVYSKTTYFDSMLTNRAMDYPFTGSRTPREVYEPGPFLHSLSESKMSNHLGFNGFVELKDKSIIFVYRGNKVSIGKGTWSTSVAASLKVRYALNEQQQLTTQGLSDAIRNEIKNELKIDIPEQEDLSGSIIAFYRDMVEGGKPQFLFYYKTDVFDNRNDFEKNFHRIMDKSDAKKKNRKEQNVDGTKFHFITIEQLKEYEIGINYMKSPDGIKYRMMPSAIASVALLLHALGGTE